MGLLLLIVIISGLALHARLFIEIQLNEFAFVKPDRIVNPIKNTFLINLNILYVHTMKYYFFSLNTYEYL